MMRLIVAIFTAFVIVLLTSPDTFSQSLTDHIDTVQLATVNVYGVSMEQRFSADSIALTREIEAMLASDQRYRKIHGLYKNIIRSSEALTA